MLSFEFNYCCAECRYAESQCVEYRYVNCHYAECCSVCVIAAAPSIYTVQNCIKCLKGDI
jgi:hypothetical protein